MGIRGRPVVGGGARGGVAPPDPPSQWARVESESYIDDMGRPNEIGIGGSNAWSAYLAFQLDVDRVDDNNGIWGCGAFSSQSNTFAIRELNGIPEIEFYRKDGSGNVAGRCFINPRPAVGVLWRIAVSYDGTAQTINLHVNDLEHRDVAYTDGPVDPGMNRPIVAPGREGYFQPWADCYISDIAMWTSVALSASDMRGLCAGTQHARQMSPDYGWLLDGDYQPYAGGLVASGGSGVSFVPYNPNLP